MRNLSSQYSDIRKQLESDEQLKSLMAGLRGSNLNDSDYAEEGVTMSLVQVSALTLFHAPSRKTVLRFSDLWCKVPA